MAHRRPHRGSRVSGEITWLSRVRATDEAAAAELAGRIQQLARAVPAEPGNLSYTVFRTAEHNTLFYIEERWATSEDATRHADRIAADPSTEQSSALMSAPIETVTLHALDPAAHQTEHHEGTTP